MPYPYRKFRLNPFTNLRVIRRTDRQTDRQTNRQTDRTKNITSFFGGGNNEGSLSFWPTVLSVTPLAHVVCLSVYRLTFCIVAKQYSVPSLVLIAQAVFLSEPGYRHTHTHTHTNSETPLVSLPHASAAPAWDNDRQ